MRRITLLLLSVLFLSACGQAAPVEETTITTTNQLTEATTQPMETKTLMETDTILLLEKSAGYTQSEIWLRDKTTEEEVLLLGRGDYLAEWALPVFVREINSRYFVFGYYVPETCNSDGGMIYDLQKGRTVNIEYSGWVFIEHIDAEKLYLETVQEDEDTTIKKYTIDIADLDSDDPIIPKEVR